MPTLDVVILLRSYIARKVECNLGRCTQVAQIISRPSAGNHAANTHCRRTLEIVLIHRYNVAGIKRSEQHGIQNAVSKRDWN